MEKSKRNAAQAESLARSLATSKRTLAVIAKRLESGDYRRPTSAGSARPPEHLAGLGAFTGNVPPRTVPD